MTEEELTKRSNWVGFAIALGLILLFSFSMLRQYRRSPRVTQVPQIPEQKADVILYWTANRQGKLEICGCPGKKGEDIAKVASGLHQISSLARKGGSTIGILEGGDFAGSQEVIPYLLECYEIMGYQALCLSPRDMAFYQQIKDKAKNTTLLLPVSEGWDHRFTIVNEKKGLAVAVVNLGAPSPTNEEQMKKVTEALTRLRSRYQVVIAVTYLNAEKVKELQKRLKGLADLILVDDPTFMVLRSAGHEGAGESDLSLPRVHRLPHLRSNVLSVLVWAGKDGAKPIVQPSEIPIHGVPDEPRVKKVVDRYFAMRQQRLQRELDKVLRVALKKDYVTPEFCGSCHQAEYNQWKETAHAHAIETLEKQGRLDKQCLTCHSLEFRLRGVITEKKNRGVECADCHTNLMDPAQARLHGQRPGERSSTPAISPAVCIRCHDRQNSPNFNYTTALPKVSH
ncbi:MAG: cytochrome c family protein [Armatimonadetes bacterium]|nr:cytochrome c family protein [Armatimonadota bacterium]MDW8121246.1 multiheme c-type cytochrome [Armatimonadota bacterium]